MKIKWSGIVGVIACLFAQEYSYAQPTKVESFNQNSSLKLIQPDLPASVVDALDKAGVPGDSVSIYVQALAEQPAKLASPLIAHLATHSLNPASTMKLLTSYAGLSLLGPSYRWKTELYTDGVINGNVLNGNLYLKAYGDPNFMTVDFWRLLVSLRQLGIREIKGDFIIDNSYFAANQQSTAEFDGESLRAYNALPSALSINLKASSFRFDSNASQVTITQEPNLPEIKVVNLLKMGAKECANWRDGLSYAVQQTNTKAIVTFTGSFAPYCTDKYLDLLVLDENKYTLNLFRKLWGELGGGFNGLVFTKKVPIDAIKLVQQDSKTLAQILPEMNKWSNNLMARQILLTIAAEKGSLNPSPANENGGAVIVKRWLNSVGLEFDELVLENGSGLSRLERISAAHMGQLLVNAYYSPVMPELLNSMPILGVDGTMLKRMKASAMQGRAHLKTGSLTGIFSLAGVVLSSSGQRYVIIFIVNHAKAAFTKAAQDALLEWVYMH